jgi:hypothetical protein
VAPEPEGSSPCSQQPATGLYPELPKSTPNLPDSLPEINSDFILPSTPVFRVVSPLGFHTKTLYTFLSIACHMPRPPHSPWFDLPNDIWGWVFIWSRSLCKFPNRFLKVQKLMYNIKYRYNCHVQYKFYLKSLMWRIIVSLEVLTAARMKKTVFRCIVSCSLAEADRRFRGSYCLHHQGDEPWWRQ